MYQSFSLFAFIRTSFTPPTCFYDFQLK